MKFVLLLFLSICKLSGLTIEEKVGQIIMCPLISDTLTEKEKNFIKKVKPGGIILYNWANDLDDKKKLESFTKSIQNFAKQENLPPLFIAIDQEGGKVDRLNLKFPSAKEIGETYNQQVALELGIQTAKALKSLNINLNFAPVVDISSLPSCPINDRSFHAEPLLVTSFAKAFAAGHLLHNTLFCLKHFPGLGDTTTDSHESLPISYKNLKQLQDHELIPYKKILPMTPLIMTAHILYPNIDEKNPASLSSICINDLLRNKLGYKGVVITNSIRMDGLKPISVYDRALKAFNAGNDIVLFGGNKLIESDPEYNLAQVESVYNYLLSCANNGKISEEKLNKSVDRIINLKKNTIL